MIVITPVSLQGNFKKEMKAYGSSYEKRYFFYTINGFTKAIQKGKVQRCGDCMIIVDEAHNIRTEKGVHAMNIIDYAKRAKKVLLLTATPVVNHPSDISNLIAIINRTKPLNKKKFKNIIEDDMSFRQYFSCKISMFSPSEEECRLLYPESTEHDIYIPMPKEYEKKYTQIEMQEMDLFLSRIFGDKNLQVFYNGVRRASNNLDESSSPKVKWIMNKIRESKKKEKFVVFSHFKKAGIRLVMDELERLNISYDFIDGTLDKEQRDEIVGKYNKNEIKVLLISKAGGEGLDLKETKNIIIMEPSWNEATHKQVIGRGIRCKSHENLPKHERHVDVFRLFCIKLEEQKKLEKILSEPLDTEYEDNLSVDLFLKKFVDEKQGYIDEFLNRLEAVSIENMIC